MDRAKQPMNVPAADRSLWSRTQPESELHHHPLIRLHTHAVNVTDDNNRSRSGWIYSNGASDPKLPFSDDIENPIVPGLKAFAQLAPGVQPVVCPCGSRIGLPLPVSIDYPRSEWSHPPLWQHRWAVETSDLRRPSISRSPRGSIASHGCNYSVGTHSSNPLISKIRNQD